VERAWPAEVVTRQFWEQVEPMHQRFVEPQRAVADEILDSPITVTTLQRLADRLKKLSSEGAQT
jgi:uridine kinase